MENWLALLRSLLGDTRTRLLLDDQVGRLAASLIREGHVEPPRLAMRHAEQAAVGSGLVTRLPAFPGVPLDEILDLRGDLAAPLGRYRTAVVRLSDRLQAGPFDRDLPDEIDDLWGAEVQPALDQIGDGLHDHGLVREIARSARQDVKTLIAEGSALYVGLAGLASVNEWISATAGLASAAVGATAAGAHRSSAARKDLRRSDLFYLYELDRRLAR